MCERPGSVSLLLILALAGLLAVLLAGLSARGAEPPEPAYILTGSLSYEDLHTYRELVFEVPPGTKRITVAFSYTGREQRTIVDLGLFDPVRFRGWSGSKKNWLTVSEIDATPSYLPGPLPPGPWRLLLGVANIRPGVVSSFVAKIYLSSLLVPSPPAGSQPWVLRSGPGWYRGDLHSHTGHSDGSCLSYSGKRVPCPEFKLLEAAVAQGLDFLAVTDHNTISHYHTLFQWQPYFDTLLLIRGREITTFQGHANLYGASEFVDFRLGHQGYSTEQLFREARRTGALLSINHPRRISGEACVGCGWGGQAESLQAHAIEVVNGPDAGTPVSGIPFWEEQLARGRRITAVGGSDDHESGMRLGGGRGVGLPTTVVYAAELSEAAILDGVRKGRVYLKLLGPRGPDLFFSAVEGDRAAMVGDNLTAAAGERISFSVRVVGGEGSVVEVLRNGERENVLADPAVASTDESMQFTWPADGGRHWWRLNLRAADGTLLALTNPIYINFPED